ncbi:putative disease resistance protein RGA3 [Bienertia sinuspersici]
MAEGVISGLVGKALEALGTAALKKAASWWGARDELKELDKTMRLIQARVHDAEMHQEADSSKAIKEWLRRLRLVLYQADDLFDEVLTRDRHKQRMQTRMSGKVGILFSKSGPLYFNRKLANEIKSIRIELDAIKSVMDGLSLRFLPAEELPRARLIQKRETASFVNIKGVVGRDDDQNTIIGMLFDPMYDHEWITVIPIVGFGGLGKTTVAQLVFNNERVKQHFDLTKWAYVPEKDNLIAIVGKIFNSFTDKDYDNLSLDQLKRGIRGSVEAKKYLLVLDDLWDEGGHRLIDLMDLLKCGKQGSRVIVTTRSEVVARTIGTIDTPYRLGTLTDDQSWDLFKMWAFKQGQQESNPAFTVIGKEIVSMCGNAPLAIKVVAGFLRSRNTEKEWLQARDAQRSKAQLTKGKEIMDVLKLSYDYLPPALKQCFAYCSLFPKGWGIDKDDLIYQWMAQGYFEPSDKDTGDQLFLELFERGFFQDSQYVKGKMVEGKMHDLVHELAQKVAGKESKLLSDESTIQITDGLVHLKLLRSHAPQPLVVGRRIRSLFLVEGNNNLKELISRVQNLRVLSVTRSSIEELPNSIGTLIHLRYLKINCDGINYLPCSITRLENLQTLNVQHCINLKELPSDIDKLISLRHLRVPDFINKVFDFPSGFEKMTSLQVLNRFIVGKSNGIDALPSLNLEGKLTITFKEGRRNAIVEAQKANLKNSDQLTHLYLDYEYKVSPPSDEMNEMLMHLQPPPNLRELHVWHYSGDEMPSKWYDGLSKLDLVGFMCCPKLKILPTSLLGLTSLRILVIINCPELENRYKKPDGEECHLIQHIPGVLW